MKNLVYSKLTNLEKNILEYCNIEQQKPVDTNAPTFNYVGQTEFIVKIGDSFKIPDITAIDNIDGEVEVTRVIKCDGNIIQDINTNVLKSYQIIYSTKDSSDNYNELIFTVHVKDMVKPIFNYNGKTTFEIEYGENFATPKITATDAVDGNIDVVVKIKYVNDNSNENYVDGNKVGTHIISYSATDKSGNIATMDIRVIVKEWIDGKWETMTPMPTARYDLTSAVLDNKIYTIGGYKSPNILKSNEAYDTMTNTWNNKKELPWETKGATCSVLNNMAYVIGGSNGKGISGFKNSNIQYDYKKDCWVYKADLLDKRTGASSSVLNNKIYIMGGINQGSTVQYDATVNAWVTKSKMLTSRWNLTACTVNNKIYTIGGTGTGTDNNGKYIGSNEQYDDISNSWTIKKEMMVPMTDISSSVLDNKIYVIGGLNTLTEYNTNTQYDFITNSWSVKKEMITKRNLLVSNTVDNKIYSIGGYRYSTALDNNERYTPYKILVNITKKPTINYTGNNILSFEVKSGINIPNITATDEAGYVEPNIEIRKNNQTVSEISNLTLGSYTLKYDFTNKIGTSTIYLTVNIVDTKPPVFEYTGSNVFEVEYGKPFTLPDVTAKDSYEGIVNVTKTIKYNGYTVSDINPTKSGEYTVTYDAKDSSNNKTAMTITVNVKYPPEGWSLGRALPSARSALSSSTLNNKIYTIGGNNDSTLSTNEQYDDITNTWINKKEMSTSRYSLTSTTLNNKIYAIGGWGIASRLDINEQYDDITNTWTTKKQISSPRYDLTSSTLNDKIYVIGGMTYNSEELYINEQYDDVTNTWTTKKEMSTDRYSLTSSTLNGKIYVIGGYGVTKYYMNEQYDDKTNTWTTKSPMDFDRIAQTSSSTLNGKIYVIGGETNNINLRHNMMYDDITNTWSIRKEMVHDRRGLTSSSLNGKIYTIGGKDLKNYLSYNEVYYPDPSDKTTKNSILPIQEEAYVIEPKKLGFNYSGERDITITQYSDFKIPLVKYIDEEGEHDTVLSIKYEKTYPISEIITAFYGKYTLQYVYKQKLLTISLNIVGKEPNVFIQPNEELFIDEIINQPTQSYTGPAPKGDNFYQVREYCLKLREERLKRESGEN